MAFELDNDFEIPRAALGVEGSSLYLKEGEKMTLRELLYGLMLRSANDAAEAIAIIVSGSVDSFVDLMNQKAAELGLCDTNFTNPHGLFDDNQKTLPLEKSVPQKKQISPETELLSITINFSSRSKAFAELKQDLQRQREDVSLVPLAETVWSLLR